MKKQKLPPAPGASSDRADEERVRARTSEMKVFGWTMGRFEPVRRPWREPVHAFCVGLVLRLASALGLAVCIVGRTRTGKTYLLDHTCRGKVLNTEGALARNNYQPLPFTVAELPRGVFAIDEAGHVDRPSLHLAAATLRCRKVVFAVQHESDLQDPGLESVLHGRRVLLLTLT